jgi:hypothetical protein
MTIGDDGVLWAAMSSTYFNGTRFESFYSSNAYATTDPATRYNYDYDPDEDTDVSWGTIVGQTGTPARPNIVYLANINMGGWADANGLRYKAHNVEGATAAENTVIETFNEDENEMLYQFINPRIAYGNGYNHVSYYDNKYKMLQYWNSNQGANAEIAIDDTVQAGEYNAIDVTAAVPTDVTVNVFYTSPNNTQAKYVRWAVADGSTVTKGQTIATLRATNNDGGTLRDTITATEPGVLTRVAAQSTNLNAQNTTTTIATIVTLISDRPVIAYLAKEGTEVVKYAYANTALPANAGNWTKAYVKPGHPNTTNAGRYISMKIDNKRGVSSTSDMHIAFMHSGNGDLIYVHGTRDAENGSYIFDDPIAIDTVGNVGKWTEITLDADGNPYISYLDQGGIDSNTGLKMAFYNPDISTATAGNKKPGTDPSGWEYVTLPGRYTVNDVRTQIECDTRSGAAWKAALAYVSGNDYRISYYVK